ncbi:MAG: LysR family transcriptional regulator [Caldilinea sp.]|nr:LysR family transcriptional regulator [Caldilinea sp.]MCO5209963.1 LysR family transcriptional regulator [Caldilinea sp.]MCW5839680.1 LysR family transcriptional regulator [Caldilinea sp.]HRW47535.1 LysR family transcriptional regulator [Caldilinea sp.]
MDFTQVQYVLAVAATGSFSGAADELYISQSSLSKKIIALERELGVTLFDRSRRQIALTPAGAAFVEHGRVIDDAGRSLLAALGEFKATPTLRIVAIPVIAQYGIAETISQFRDRHPEIALTLEEREASAILPALESQQFDLAFLRDNYLDRADFRLCEVVKDRLQVAISRKHRFADRSSLALAALADENHIMFDKGTVVHELAVDACRAAGFEPRIFYASLRIESVLGLVASNSGVALMMEKVVAYHRHPDVLAIALDELIESCIVLAAPRATRLSRPARLFMDFVAEQSLSTAQS